MSYHLRARPKHLPILLLFVTDLCNLRCRMCGVWEHAEPGGEGELSTDEWKAVIASGAKLRAAIVSFTGGEVLLRRDIFDLIEHAKRHRIATHVCTNGTLLDEGNVDRLRECGVGTVSVSIESATPQEHDYLRGEGTFEKAVRGTRLLRERAPEIRVGINSLITAQNFRHMEAMIPFAESLGVHQLKFAPIHTNLQHRCKRREEFGDLVFHEDDLDELQAALEGLVRALGTTKLHTTSLPFLAGITDLYRRPPKTRRCYAGYAACAVNPQGRVGPCSDMLSQFSVREKPLEEIWASPGFHELRERVRQCDEACWDTTNAELSLRLQLRNWASSGGIGYIWRDLKFYFGGHRA